MKRSQEFLETNLAGDGLDGQHGGEQMRSYVGVDECARITVRPHPEDSFHQLWLGRLRVVVGLSVMAQAPCGDGRGSARAQRGARTKIRNQLDGSIGGFEWDEVCHVRDDFGCAVGE